MASEAMRTSRVVALTLVVGAAFVCQEIFTQLAGGERIHVVNDAIIVLAFWVGWAVLTPAVTFALRRWPLRGKPAYRPILVHAVVGIVLAMVQTAISLRLQVLVHQLQGGLDLILVSRMNPVAYAWGMFASLCCYAVILMVYTTANLEAELSRSKLDSLRSQLQPHFLFNTLNAISVFVAEDADKAQRMLLRLSSLLRRSLDEESHEVPLARELRFVNDYLDIQRGRFGDQLDVHLDIDPTVLEANVPVFLLQPLLENAIEHGKSEHRPASIALHATRDQGALRITISDNGPGVGNGRPVRERIGLQNTRARLLHLYGARATIDLRAADPGACVEIRIPLGPLGALS